MIHRLLKHTGLELPAINAVVLHQANQMILDFLIRKLGLESKILPTSIREFGNTGSASIPLSLVVDRKLLGAGCEKVILAGFGVGLSWGAALVDLSETIFSRLIEVETL
jgi:3-oxoacyl-[acyl-carrier-protein] synthase-3